MPLPLVLLFLLNCRSHFPGKRVHLTDKKTWHLSCVALPRSHHTHTTQESTCEIYIYHSSDLFPWIAGREELLQGNFSMINAMKSPIKTRRTAGEMLHEEYKRLWKLYGELHLTYTYAELRNYCFLEQFLKNKYKGTYKLNLIVFSKTGKCHVYLSASAHSQ